MYPYNVQSDAICAGIYRFRFFHLGEWIDVLIDDQLPVKKCAVAVQNRYWMPLLEKAYAKFLGSYNMLQGGDPCWSLYNLTGGIVLEVKSINFEKFEMLKYKKNFSLFDWIHRNKQKSIFTSSIYQKGGEIESKTSTGLIVGHAYAILDTARLKLKSSNNHVEMLKLRNPWATTTWTGAWSRTSRMWNQSKQIVDRERYYPENSCKTGEFWISWEDWVKTFSILNICYIPDERYVKPFYILKNVGLLIINS